MSDKHTPGPLVADYNTPELPYRIVSKVTGGNVGYAYTEADADLLATAPELLDVLESALQIVDAYRKAALGDGDICAANCRAVIAKAKGGAA